MSLFKPMLAADADLEKLRFPLLASAKLDGIRAIVIDGVVLSRSLKPIPNEWVQSLLKIYTHHDGELIVGDPTNKMCYRDTVSAVMSKDGKPDVKFYVFDHILRPTHNYQIRIAPVVTDGCVYRHKQHVVTCMQSLLQLEEKYLDEGYEGLILRDPNAPYKFGRSTAKEGYLLKLKRFEDAEAEIIGFEERQQNNNEAKTNALGHTERSSHKANKSGRGDLGALLVRTGEGVSFAIGTGFTDDERKYIWDNQDQFLGRLAKYKHFVVGGYDAPRHPVYLGLRDEKDKS